MSSEAKAKASGDLETGLTIEERKDQCRQLMEKVVSMRLQYTKYIKKIDLRIAHEEQKLFKRDLDQKLPVESARHTVPESLFDDSIVESCRQMEKEDSKLRNELTDQLGNLQKITEQIRNDNVHRVTREPIDSETIINRAKKTENVTELQGFSLSKDASEKYLDQNSSIIRLHTTEILHEMTELKVCKRNKKRKCYKR